MKVITWSDPRGNCVDITPDQEAALSRSGYWPRTEFGEYCQVQRGLHGGEPTWTDDEIAAMCRR